MRYFDMVEYVNPAREQIEMNAKREAMKEFKKLFGEGLKGNSFIKIRPYDEDKGVLLYSDYTLRLYVEEIANVIGGAV